MNTITRTILLLFFLAANSAAMAQNYASSVGFSAGYVEDGFGGNATFNFHPNRFSYIQIGVFASFSEEDFDGVKIPYNVFSFQPGYYRRIFLVDWRKPVGIYLGGGGIAGYEVINNGNNELPSGALITAESKFIYGGFASLEIEWQIKESFSLALKANQHYHVNSDIGNLYPFVGLSLRYYLY
ncbi:MAG: conjugal transfer protein TraO [Bacteroidota bacterium]